MANIIVYTIYAVRYILKYFLKIVPSANKNLGERFYDTSYFHDRVERFLINDHNVPKLK